MVNSSDIEISENEQENEENSGDDKNNYDKFLEVINHKQNLEI